MPANAGASHLVTAVKKNSPPFQECKRNLQFACKLLTSTQAAFSYSKNSSLNSRKIIGYASSHVSLITPHLLSRVFLRMCVRMCVYHQMEQDEAN